MHQQDRFQWSVQKGQEVRSMDRLDGKHKYLGNFTKARDAAMAYNEAIVELSGKSIDELKLNFPDGMSGFVNVE